MCRTAVMHVVLLLCRSHILAGLALRLGEHHVDAHRPGTALVDQRGGQLADPEAAALLRVAAAEAACRCCSRAFSCTARSEPQISS